MGRVDEKPAAPFRLLTVIDSDADNVMRSLLNRAIIILPYPISVEYYFIDWNGSSSW